MFRRFFMLLAIAIVCAEGTKYPASCTEALGGRIDNGIYKIELPDSALPPFNVYCLADPENGDPWMVIQRRKDGSVDFRRDWVDYKNGFGNLNGEFWLGLELLHAITYDRMHEIWFQMEDFKEGSYAAYYHEFVIGDENSKYMLETLGNYSGDAGDSFNYHDRMMFSTRDSDNDLRPNGSCIGTITSGGWWFADCRESNFNGLYYSEETTLSNGINWYGVHGKGYSMKAVHMAIRSVEGDYSPNVAL